MDFLMVKLFQLLFLLIFISLFIHFFKVSLYILKSSLQCIFPLFWYLVFYYIFTFGAALFHFIFLCD